MRGDFVDTVGAILFTLFCLWALTVVAALAFALVLLVAKVALLIWIWDRCKSKFTRKRGARG
jgi:hypothetical protein